jgi:hypothetical protein
MTGGVVCPSLPKTHDHTLQNFTLLKEGIKQYVNRNLGRMFL